MKNSILTEGGPARHFWLTRSVARAMGVNLSEAMARGAMSAKGYARLVGICRQCHCVERCELWLATHAMAEARALGDCPNRSSLEALQ